MGPVGSLWVSGALCGRRLWNPKSYFLLFCFQPWNEQFYSGTCSCYDTVPCHRSKNNGATKWGTTTSQTGSQHKPALSFHLEDPGKTCDCSLPQPEDTGPVRVLVIPPSTWRTQGGMARPPVIHYGSGWGTYHGEVETWKPGKVWSSSKNLNQMLVHIDTLRLVRLERIQDSPNWSLLGFFFFLVL